MNGFDFDKTIDTIYNDDISINIGYIKGNNDILFIKTGQNGSIYGYENKYINIANRVNTEYSCTVFVSSTISDKKEVYDAEMKVVSSFFPDEEYNIYYFGVSKGGLIGCWHGADNPKLKRIVSVNAPLMINFFNKTKPAIEKLTMDKIIFVYGENDPSYLYTDLLKEVAICRIIEGADHYFKNKLTEFEEIIDESLLFDLKREIK